MGTAPSKPATAPIPAVQAKSEEVTSFGQESEHEIDQREKIALLHEKSVALQNAAMNFKNRTPPPQTESPQPPTEAKMLQLVEQCQIVEQMLDEAIMLLSDPNLPHPKKTLLKFITTYLDEITDKLMGEVKFTNLNDIKIKELFNNETPEEWKAKPKFAESSAFFIAEMIKLEKALPNNRKISTLLDKIAYISARSLMKSLRSLDVELQVLNPIPDIKQELTLHRALDKRITLLKGMWWNWEDEKKELIKLNNNKEKLNERIAELKKAVEELEKFGEEPGIIFIRTRQQLKPTLQAPKDFEDLTLEAILDNISKLLPILNISEELVSYRELRAEIGAMKNLLNSPSKPSSSGFLSFGNLFISTDTTAAEAQQRRLNLLQAIANTWEKRFTDFITQTAIFELGLEAQFPKAPINSQSLAKNTKP